MNALSRFLDIVHANQTKDEVLAIIGLGSIHDTKRLDQFSDVDFFMIVEDSYVSKYLNSIHWLNVAPIILSYQETEDGYKVIYEDGVLLEFAVFSLKKLQTIPFQEGTIYYKKDHIKQEDLKPKLELLKKPVDLNYLVPDVLSNLYVGLLRELRGEQVAAFLMIQVYASHKTLRILDRIIDDPFVLERRIESRIALDFSKLYPGVMNNLESIQFQLECLQDYLKPHKKVVDMIHQLIENTL